MIFRVRLEGGAESADVLEREFHALASHIALVAYMEGFSGGELRDAETVIESVKWNESVKVGDSNYSFRLKGRHSFVLDTYPHQMFDPLRPKPQPDYEVVWLPETDVSPLPPGVQVTGPLVTKEEQERIVQKDVIVLQRSRPVDMEVEEERSAEDILDMLRCSAHVQSVRVEPAVTTGAFGEYGWAVIVVFASGKDDDFEVVSEPTLRQAAEAMFRRLRETNRL